MSRVFLDFFYLCSFHTQTLRQNFACPFVQLNANSSSLSVFVSRMRPIAHARSNRPEVFCSTRSDARDTVAPRSSTATLSPVHFAATVSPLQFRRYTFAAALAHAARGASDLSLVRPGMFPTCPPASGTASRGRPASFVVSSVESGKLGSRHFQPTNLPAPMQAKNCCASFNPN